MYKLPLEIIKGRRPFVSQEFGNHSNDAWYAANGLNFSATGHNGTDIIIVGGKNVNTDTYGTKIVCPFPNATLGRVWFEGAMNTKGNGVEFFYNEPKRQIKVKVWHCSECDTQPEYKEGDAVGYIGNTGLCSPAPTFWSPYAGSHLHLMTYIDGNLCNPREIFNFTKWYVSDTEDTKKDIPPLQWALDFFKSLLANMAK